LLLKTDSTSRTSISHIAKNLFDHIPIVYDSDLIPVSEMYDVRKPHGRDIPQETGVGSEFLESLCKHDQEIQIPDNIESLFTWPSGSTDVNARPAIILARILLKYMNAECVNHAVNVEQQAHLALQEAKRQLDFAQRLANVALTMARAGIEGVYAAIHINTLIAYVELIEQSLNHIQSHQTSHMLFESKLEYVYQLVEDSVTESMTVK
jgi:hypothetical protein